MNIDFEDNKNQKENNLHLDTTSNWSSTEIREDRHKRSRNSKIILGIIILINAALNIGILIKKMLDSDKLIIPILLNSLYVIMMIFFLKVIIKVNILFKESLADDYNELKCKMVLFIILYITFLTFRSMVNIIYYFNKDEFLN